MKLLLGILGIVAGVALTLLGATVANAIWGWFLIPAGLPDIGFSAFLGASFLISVFASPYFLYGIVEEVVKNNDNISQEWRSVISGWTLKFSWLVVLLLIWLTSFLYKLAFVG